MKSIMLSGISIDLSESYTQLDKADENQVYLFS
jgi:hypothetical protein